MLKEGNYSGQWSEKWRDSHATLSCMCEVAWDPLRGPYIENYVPGAKKMAK